MPLSFGGNVLCAHTTVGDDRTFRNLYCGLSGIDLPMRKSEYPADFRDRSRLAFYGSMFNSIEVNGTFYKIPRTNTIARWASDVPEDFRFTFKLYQEFTHKKDSTTDTKLLSTFFDTINHVGGKRGCILVQFPPSYGSSMVGHLTELLKEIAPFAEEGGWRIAVEFRNRSWYAPQVFEMLTFYDSALVLQDLPKSSTPFVTTANDVIYLRFHGPTGNYRGSYDDSFLTEYVSYINEWLEDGKEVYCYFNNTAGEAFGDLQRLKQHLQQHV